MWYVVQPEDTLYSISLRFQTPIAALIRTNQIAGAVVYPGQKLFISTMRQSPITYTVKPNDSLYLISRRYNTTVKSIMVLNDLSSVALTIGQTLKIPLYTEVVVKVDTANIRRGPGLNYETITNMGRNARLPVLAVDQDWYRVKLYDGTSGWIFDDTVNFLVYDGSKPITGIVGFYTLAEGPALPGSFASFANNPGLISELCVFTYRISASNPTEIEKFGTFTDQDINTLVAIAHRNNVKILPVVHNLLYRPGGTTLAKDVIKVLVSNPQNRSAFILNLIELIERHNFDGVNIDIEDVYIEDSAGVSALYTEMGEALHRRGLYLSASVPARVSDQPFNPFSDPFNYAAIGRAVDQFIVMLYNEHGWPGSGPGPVVSIGWMERVLRYTMSKMPKEKIVAAVSVFGFDFNLTTKRNTYVTYEMAMDLANKYNKDIIFDQETQTPMFAYKDEEGNDHEVWFENSESLLAKIRLAWELGISGVALWRLGMEDQDVWRMLAEDVVVRKF